MVSLRRWKLCFSFGFENDLMEQADENKFNNKNETTSGFRYTDNERILTSIHRPHCPEVEQIGIHDYHEYVRNQLNIHPQTEVDKMGEKWKVEPTK